MINDFCIRHVLISLVVGGFAVSGCGGSNLPERYPVEGQVLREKKPLAEAIVTFHPTGPATYALAKPVGYTDSNGRFRLSTINRDDGAVPGEYAITVELRAPVQVGEEIMRNGPNQLPARYAQPDQSGFRYRVVPRPNRVDPLVILER